MNSYLSKKKALACPIHKAVREEAATKLQNTGAFSKEEVIIALSFEAVEDSIRWDYIREFLENDEGCELIPVVSIFFQSKRTKARKESPIDIKPEKYLASGHGKKTAGYVSVKPDEHCGLVMHRLEQRKGIANGVGKAFRAYLTAIQTHGSAPVKLAIGKEKTLPPPRSV